MKKKKTRIQNANKYLPFFLQEGEYFHVGLLFEDFLQKVDLKKYNFSEDFKKDSKIVPPAKGATTRSNIHGKFTRKQPEEKTTKTVHISFNKKDGTHIEYDRDYHVFVKELRHKFNISLNYKINKHGQKVIVSDKLLFDDLYNNIQKNTHVINIFCEISNDFEIFNIDLEPAIHFNKKFEEDILPKGRLEDNDTFDELTAFAGRYTKNENETKAFQKRLHVLKDFQPDIRGKGPSNFFGYIVFGFKDLGIAILETMYSDNATYIFKLSDFENNAIKDKQTVLKEKLLLKRIFHYGDWEDRIKRYIDNVRKEKKK